MPLEHKLTKHRVIISTFPINFKYKAILNLDENIILVLTF